MTAATYPVNSFDMPAPPSAWTHGGVRPYVEVPAMDEEVARPRRLTVRAQPLAALAAAVAEVVANSETDFVTVEALAVKLEVPPIEIRVAISLLGNSVRRPLGQAANRFPSAYRWNDRGLTRKEKWWRFRAIAGRTTI